MLKSINPKNNSTLTTYELNTADEIEKKLQSSHQSFLSWKLVPVSERKAFLLNLSQQLRSNTSELAELMTKEMVKYARELYDKCWRVCDIALILDQKYCNISQVIHKRHFRNIE